MRPQTSHFISFEKHLGGLQWSSSGRRAWDPTVASNRNSPAPANFLSLLFPQHPYDSDGISFAIRGDLSTLFYTSRSRSIRDNDLFPFPFICLCEIIMPSSIYFITLLALQVLLFNFPSDGDNSGQDDAKYV